LNGSIYNLGIFLSSTTLPMIKKLLLSTMILTSIGTYTFADFSWLNNVVEYVNEITFTKNGHETKIKAIKWKDGSYLSINGPIAFWNTSDINKNAGENNVRVWANGSSISWNNSVIVGETSGEFMGNHLVSIGGSGTKMTGEYSISVGGINNIIEWESVVLLWENTKVNNGISLLGSETINTGGNTTTVGSWIKATVKDSFIFSDGS